MHANTQTKPGARRDDPKTSPEPGPQQAPPEAPTDPLQAVLERARQGDQTVLPQLRQLLDDNPHIWLNCHSLVAMSEQAWLDAMAGKDLLFSQSVRRQVEQLKLDLVGPTPPPLEKLLADRIAAAWLAVNHADMAEAFGQGSGIKVAQLQVKRLESANKRFLAATKALAVARRLTNGLKIEINHTTASPAPAANQPAAMNDAANAARVDAVAHDPVRERLRAMFQEEADLVSEKEAVETAHT
jgi:hypothetical protein